MRAACQLIRDYREQRGITQVYIAKKSGISARRLCQLEKGYVRLSADDMLNIVTKGFEISPIQFFSTVLSETENRSADLSQN